MKLILTLVYFGLVFKTLSQTESHLTQIRQLTHGGDNAEAYFNFKGQQLVFQSNNPRWNVNCDQIFLMDINAAAKDTNYLPKRISTGKGRTTCSYFLKNNTQIVYASTHAKQDSCPKTVTIKGKYLWSVDADYDIYLSDLNGQIQHTLTNHPGYDAEATVSPKGDRMVFTSDRSGDLELWTMKTDGTDLKQITFGLGYDGGAFFSPDGESIVFRASRPKTTEEIAEYKSLLAQHLVAPSQMELYVCSKDGSNLRSITQLGKANWAPFFLPDGKRIIFSSNHHSSRGYDFQLYLINIDGSGLERVTHESYFNAFPMFSPDGKYLVFSSNRNNHGTRDTNVFIAQWKD
jgi:Tol biopolymer transport system component